MTKKILYIVLTLLLCLSLSGCFKFAKDVELTGELITKDFSNILEEDINSFQITKLYTKSKKIKVVLKNSSEPYIKVTAQESLFDELNVNHKISGIYKQIIIKGNDAHIYVSKEDILIEIGSSKIQGIFLNNCNSEIDGSMFDNNITIGFSQDTYSKISDLDCEKINLECSGASVVEFNKLNASKISIECSGASNITINDVIGDTNGNLDIECSGASIININSLNIKNLDIEFSGNSILKAKNINVSNKIDIEASGESNIELVGSSNEIETELSGKSTVLAFDLITKIASIEASGSCKIQMTIEDKLNAELSGSSAIKYKGRPQIGKINTSGSSKIEWVE